MLASAKPAIGNTAGSTWNGSLVCRVCTNARGDSRKSHEAGCQSFSDKPSFFTRKGQQRSPLQFSRVDGHHRHKDSSTAEAHGEAYVNARDAVVSSQEDAINCLQKPTTHRRLFTLKVAYWQQHQFNLPSQEASRKFASLLMITRKARRHLGLVSRLLGRGVKPVVVALLLRPPPSFNVTFRV